MSSQPNGVAVPANQQGTVVVAHVPANGGQAPQTSNVQVATAAAVDQIDHEYESSEFYIE
ncbi:hypothetical protein FRC18_009432 [Serendipita sp. 400]|nr:hypothetical protein FRC18_009432 [Serendipita sp. 400]